LSIVASNERPDEPLVEAIDLRKEFRLPSDRLFQKYRDIVRAVDDVSLQIRRGEILGLVGETGSGKSTFGRLLLALQTPTAGRVIFDGIEIGRLSAGDLRKLRRRMQMIFQDPYASLNPRKNVVDVIGSPLHAHGIGTRRSRNDRARELMAEVGVNPRYGDRFPHQFSGGQQQRIAIARALALNPDFIIADEPVSALDVSIQAQILNLLIDLQRDRNLTYLFIAHDLSIVRHVSDRVAVMYLGGVVELAPSGSFYESPFHPYSSSLLSAIPVPDPAVERQRRRIVLRGDLPTWSEVANGCRFSSRCPIVQDICREVRPPLFEHASGHWAACHFVDRAIELHITHSATSKAVTNGP